MKIVIVGGGKVGIALAAQLTREGHDITLIESNREKTLRLSGLLDIRILNGNGASLGVLREADTHHSDLLIAATHQDEINMMCCIVARKMGCKNTIARIRDAAYLEQMYLLKNELGLSMTITPEQITAREIFRLMQIPGFLKRDTFAKGRVEIVELVAKPGGLLDGISLVELSRKLKVKVLVCAVQRGEDAYIPDGSFVVRQGDKIYVTAPSTDLAALMDDLGIKQHRVRDAMLIGGSRIAAYLTRMLVKSGVRVKLLERDARRAETLAEYLPGATIIHADGTDQNILREENIERMDSVVTLTNMDEENLVVSLFANKLGVSQVITKLNRTEYTELFAGSGLDCIISPKQLCAQAIIRYVRAMQNRDGSSVLAVHHLVDGKVEAMEFNVTESTRNRGIPLKDIQLKPNVLLASIGRMNRSILPGGNDTMELGDSVVVVTVSDRVLLDLNDIFAEEER